MSELIAFIVGLICGALLVGFRWFPVEKFYISKEEYKRRENEKINS